MKEYKAKAVISLHAGKVALTPEQVAPRMHALEEEKKKGVYTIKDTIHFKAGEVFGYDGDIPKVLSDKVGSPDDKDEESVKIIPMDRAFLDEHHPDLVAEIKAEGVAEEIREQDIMEAIEMLDAGNPEHFTDAGLPQVKAIEELLNDNISAAERDAAYARMTPPDVTEDNQE